MIITAGAALCLLTAVTSAAQEADSLRTYPIDEAVITGTRNRTDVRHLSQTVSVVNRDKIEQTMQPSLLPVLNEQIPGLFTTARGIMGYGVSGGAAGGISLRGLSGGSARMMVLIDGHPQYAGIFGHPVADAYQTLLADRVEVLRGPASVLYGSNAMGGVINIVTRQPEGDGFKGRFHTGYGSYNTLETEAGAMLKSGSFSANVSASYNRTDGHRENMGFSQYGGYAKLGYQFTDNWQLLADLDLTHFDASCPGPVSAPLVDADQGITRGMTSLSVKNDYGKTSGALSFFYNWGRHSIGDGHTADVIIVDKYTFESYDDMMGVSLYQSAVLFEGNRTTVGADWFRYGGKAWNAYQMQPDKDLVDKHETELAAYFDFRQHIGSVLTLNAGLRADHHSRIGTEWVPQAGAAVHLPHHIEMKASVAKGFRYPILREMYMFPPQNPDLKPESSWNYELAISQKLLGGRLSYGVNLFHIDAKNIILTLPNPSGAGKLNQNSGELHNSGAEIQAAWRISRAWSVNANYSYLHMKEPVIAAPEHKAYAGASWTEGRWSVSTGLQYVAGLYTSTSPVQKEDFLLWNVRSSFKVCKWLDLWARGENLLAQEYEINAGYPMPGGTVVAGFDIRL